jgi:uncharacterized membrane protein YhiD involved in acid resistance
MMPRRGVRPEILRTSFVLLFVLMASGRVLLAAPQPEPLGSGGQHELPISDVAALVEASIRMPVAALLGTALAFRPRRRGTPRRNPPVIQTQILLAVVGALVMMVVGSSLARAFGIVGAAGLIRYRAKIEDPKDAGVMLATLGVGLATGVGLYLLAVFATVFFLLMLGIVESLDEGDKRFDLTVKAENVDRLRGEIEALLGRQQIEFELRTVSEEELCYAVLLPLGKRTDRISNAIHRLAQGKVAAVGWEERKPK